MNGHVLKALLWRLWRSSRRRYFAIPICIIFPLLNLESLTRVKIQQSGGTNIINGTFPIPKPYQYLFDHSNINGQFDIMYYPNNTVTQAIMSNFKKHMPSNFLFNLKGMNSEVDVETYFANNYKSKFYSSRRMAYGVIFKEVTKDRLSYALRNTKMDVWKTKKLFPSIELPGPDNAGGNYESRGFLTVQSGINMAYMDYVKTPYSDWFYQEFPYPPYIEESVTIFEMIYHYGITMIMLFGLVPLMMLLVGRIVTEKSLGVKEVLRLNGISNFGIHAYWFVFFMFMCAIIMTAAVIMLTVDFGRIPLLEYSNRFLLWLFFMLFSIHLAFLLFAVSSIFSNSTYAISLSLTIFITLMSAVIKFERPTNSAIGFLSVMTPMGFLYSGVKIIVTLEVTNVGLQFNQLLYTVPNSDVGPMLLLVFGMICGSALLILFFTYMNAVRPGSYGTAEPWHYIFPSFLKNMCRGNPNKNHVVQERTTKSIVEEANLPVGIKIQNLHKVFGALNAVNGLSMDVYHDQITVLLGHNGAGKTTLMSILTGVLSPTSGNVTVGGSNIFENMSQFRKDIGLCPQDNILLDDLSVFEQIIFFGMLRGRSKAQVSRKAKDLMTKFNIRDRKNAFPNELSGGMKRKLCLAISMANDPKFLFLDEPTSGLDPQSRRGIWDTLLTLRGNRTIIITTHFMEEADVLGDKIAIMAHGEMRCYGTPIFLKRYFGSGHRVTVSYMKESNPYHITNIVKNHIPGVMLFDNKQQSQITFNTTLSETYKLPSTFLELEHSENLLNIKNIGVTCTSMEEVFLKVQEGEGISTDFDESDFTLIGNKKPKKNSGITLIMQQFFSLLVKRVICLKSSIIFGIFTLILAPYLLTSIAMSLTNAVTIQSISTPLDLNLSIYGKTSVVVGGKNSPYMDSYIKNVRASNGIEILSPSQTAERELYQSGERDLAYFRYNMIVAADFFKAPTALYSSIGLHGPPIAINMLFNALVYPKSIQTINHPYNFENDPCDSFSVISILIPIAWIVFGAGTMYSTIFFVRFPMSERLNGMKQLQYMSGLSPVLYWMSNLFFDLFLFCIVIIVSFGTSYVLDTNNILEDFDVLRYMLLIIILYGIGMLSACYVLSTLFKTQSLAITTMFVCSIVFACMPTIMDYFTNNNPVAHYFSYLSPTTPYILSIYKIMNVVTVKLTCKNCSRIPNCDQITKNMDFGINICLIFLVVDIVLFYIVALLLDYRYIQLVIHLIKEKIYGPIKPSTNADIDVYKEKQNVIAGNLGTIQSEDLVLITDSLGKKYGKNFTAVHDISFTAKKGECFGLLGVNGAGKTTTFSMLSGAIFPSQGDANMHVANGYHTLSNARSNFLQNIGYCPQKNYICENMTARQLLSLFAILRGASMNDAREMTEQWIKNLDLHLYCDKPCGKYSGGNKRKLCTAIALIADPPVILLDEPTTGVDPVTRRKLWKVFKQIQSNDQTIILTSHSMDECEATCDRLTIMVRGKMRCIGSIQHLKHKFAQGFTIFIKLDLTAEENEVNQIKESLYYEFGGSCLLKDEYKGFLGYHLGDIGYKWSQIFGKMESMKNRFQKIDEYMLSDTSLEQVFISLAKKQLLDFDP